MLMRDSDFGPIYERQQRQEDAGNTPAAPAAPTQPRTETPPAPEPGPSQDPGGGQDGPPPANQPPPAIPRVPPAISSVVEGVEGSKDTGGVKGTFSQAGTSDFAKKFGGAQPAVWFRNALRGASTGGGQINKDVLSRAATSRAGGQAGGGAIPSESAIPMGPSEGGQGGGENDAEWQRFMQAVMQQRFGKG